MLHNKAKKNKTALPTHAEEKVDLAKTDFETPHPDFPPYPYIDPYIDPYGSFPPFVPEFPLLPLMPMLPFGAEFPLLPHSIDAAYAANILMFPPYAQVPFV